MGGYGLLYGKGFVNLYYLLLIGGVHRARKFQEGLKSKGFSDVGFAMLTKQV